MSANLTTKVSDILNFSPSSTVGVANAFGHRETIRQKNNGRTTPNHSSIGGAGAGAILVCSGVSGNTWKIDIIVWGTLALVHLSFLIDKRDSSKPGDPHPRVAHKAIECELTNDYYYY